MILVMGVFDVILLGFVALSAVVGLYRGFIAECLTLSSWFIAGLLTYLYSGIFATMLMPYLHSHTLSLVVMSLMMITVLMIFTKLLGRILAAVMTSLGLKTLDHIMGLGFGMVRGWLLLMAVIAVMVLLHLDHDIWFQQSVIVPHVKLSSARFASWVPIGHDWVQQLSLNS